MHPPKGVIVYADKWLTLNTNGTLQLHRYYFCKPTRTLHVDQIEYVESVAALDLGRWEYKDWGIGLTWIMWTMDFGRGSLSWNGPSVETKKRLLLIRTREGKLHKVGVTCLDVDKFLNEIEKLGVSVVGEGDI